MALTDDLEKRLSGGAVVIMDGGTGTEIQRRGIPMGSKTWSGDPLLIYPDVVREIHQDYIRAGAEIVITNTFSTGRYILKDAGLGERTVEINKLGVKVAREARDNLASSGRVVIAGSMSTYSPWTDPTVIPAYEAALTDYREQARALAEAGVDLIVVEMLIRTLDTRAAVQAAVETSLPVWVGFSLQKDGQNLYLGVHGKHGDETIAKAVDSVAQMGVSALFIMHSLSEDTGPGIQQLRQQTSLPIGAYAHSIGFSTPEPQNEAVVTLPLSPDEYSTYARQWVDMGAQIIGGCCGTTPEHIRVLKETLPDQIPV